MTAYAASHYGYAPTLIHKTMARQGVDMWVQRWYCPACGGRRPDGHLEGCEVVKQLGRV